MSSIKINQQIIAEANIEFGNHGFQNTSVSAIAMRCGIPKSTIYYHYKSKKTLFAAVVSSEIKQMKKVLLQIIDNKLLRDDEKLIAFLNQHLQLIHQAKYSENILNINFVNEFDELIQEVSDWHNWAKTQIDNLVIQGIKDNLFADSVEVTMLSKELIMVLNGLETSLITHPHYEEISIHLDEFLRILLSGIRKKS